MLTKGNQNCGQVSHTHAIFVYFVPDAAPPPNKIKLTSFVPGDPAKSMELDFLDDNVVLTKS
jgi:hypothetical protein